MEISVICVAAHLVRGGKARIAAGFELLGLFGHRQVAAHDVSSH